MYKLPRDYTDAICGYCRNMRLDGKTHAEIIQAHDDCHGWTHCYRCCGPCTTCGQEGAGFDEEDED